MIIYIKNKLRNLCKTNMRKTVNQYPEWEVSLKMVQLLEQMDKNDFKRRT